MADLDGMIDEGFAGGFAVDLLALVEVFKDFGGDGYALSDCEMERQRTLLFVTWLWRLAEISMAE
jgi:hypothetical protein